ncbi:MAG: hypothetical protein ABI600_00865 [Luteolibacter sp.]
MKPLPTQVFPVIHVDGSGIPSLPTILKHAPGPYSTTNRRTSTCPTQRIYPWLLVTSTAVAALFCLMYITKPVILAAPNPSPMVPHVEKTADTKAVTPALHAELMPNGNQLPGEMSSSPANKRLPNDSQHQALQTAPVSAFEETNLRIQHILTAEAPGGNLARIDIEVPVLYQSRNLRWTASEVAEARALLVRLADYQEKSQMLRAEGIQLLDTWNRLVEHSIPAGELRADSPTLPINQQDAADAPRPAGLSTSESIQIQRSGK